MASDTVSVFLGGDSYVHDGVTPTWPVQLVAQIGGAACNFAQANVKSDALVHQIEEFEKSICSNRIQRVEAAIIHVGGNNLLEDMEATMGEGGKSIADTVCLDVKAGIESLKKMGVERFVVADVPFSTHVPHIKGLIKEYADCMHCNFAEAERLARASESALNQKMSGMIQGLRQECPEINIIQFHEVSELQKWKADEDLFDETGLHPNQEGHAKLQKAMLELWNMEGFPTGSAKALPSSTQTGSAVLTPEKTRMPSKRTLDDDAGGDSLEKQFVIACEKVDEMKEQRKLSIASLSELYGLYKHIKEGDNEVCKPGFFSSSQVDKIKWQAWFNCRGKTQGVAKDEYVTMVNQLSGGADGKRGRRS